MFSSSKSLFRKPGGGPGPTPTDATFGYVPLLLETGSASSLNTTVTDSAQTPNTVTRTNNPSTGWVSPYQTDGYWGNQFNGSSDYLTVPFNTSLNLGSSDFTIEAWVYFNSLPSNTWYTIYSYGNSSGTQRFSLYFDTRTSQSSPGLRFSVIDSVGTTLLDFSGGGTSGWNAGAWYHVALTRSTNTWTLYRNGTSIGTTINSTSIPNPSSGGAYIGIESTLVALWNGYFSNLRVVKGVAVYTGAFTPPTSPLQKTQAGNGSTIQAITGSQTSLLTCQSNRFIDNSIANSGVGFTVTPTGTPRVDPYFYPSGFTAPAASPGAALFNGSSQYLSSTTASTVLQFGSNPYTVEGWVYHTSRPTYSFICGGVFSGTGFQAFINSSGFVVVSVPGVGDLTASTIAVRLNAWTHFAIVRTSTSAGGFTYYINGVAAGTPTDANNYSGTATTFNVATTNNSSLYLLPGYIGNLRIVKGTAVYTGAFTPPSGPLTQTGGTYPSLTNVVTGFTAANTSLLLALSDSNYNSATDGVQNNTFIDDSNYAFPITRNGTPTQGSITPYWPNGQWSNFFNGSNAYLTSTIPALSGQFTIDFWVYRPASGNNWFFTIGDAISGSGSLEVYIGSSGGAFNLWVNNLVRITDSPTPAVGAWSYVAVTRDASNQIRFYLNGTQVSPATVYTSSVTFATTLRLGVEFYNSGFQYGNNYISNFRISNNVRTVTSVPTSFFVADGNTLFLGCQSNRFRDTSSNNATITPSGTPTVQAFQPFSPTASYTTALYGGSGYFNGTTDFLSAPDSDVFLLTGDFTIEAWVYQTSSKNVTIVGQWPLTGAVSFICKVQSTGKLGFTYDLGAGGVNGSDSTNAITYNSWNHVVWSRSGSTQRYFINGVLDATTNAISGSFVNSAGALTIGLYNTGDNTYFNGYLSSVRFIKGTAVYTGNFTPPTAPVTAITNTSLLLNFTNAGIYDAAVQNVITTVGDAQASSAITAKWPPTSIRFDGTGDYLSVSAGSPQSLTFGTGDFTIEFWVYFTSNTGFQTLYDGRAAAGIYPLLYLNNGVINYYVGSNTAITSVQPSTGVWTFMSLRRSSGTTQFFINGTQSGGNYTDSNNYLAPPTSGARVGANFSGSDFLSGYIQDFRVTKAARAATPIPTAAFPTR